MGLSVRCPLSIQQLLTGTETDWAKTVSSTDDVPTVDLGSTAVKSAIANPG